MFISAIDQVLPVRNCSFDSRSAVSRRAWVQSHSGSLPLLRQTVSQDDAITQFPLVIYPAVWQTTDSYLAGIT